MTSTRLEPGTDQLGTSTPAAPTLGRDTLERAHERRALLVAWVLVGASFTWAVWSHRWMSDDGFINLRIVDNILSGHGPVFNAGQRVEAGTSPLWLGVLAVGQATFGRWIRVEWVTVALGITCSLGTIATSAVTQRRTWCAPVAPAAILVWVALPSVWDFSSSGLETPLLWLWIAATAGALMVRAVSNCEVEPWRPWWLCVLVGIGPLIRPDAAVYTGCFLVALLVVSRRSWRGAVRAVALALAVPFAYEVFRAGYFGILVPNTALAKEAGEAQWATGFAYLQDLLAFAATWAAIVAVATLAFVVLRTGAVVHRLGSVWVACWTGALLHLIWVVRVGGDFMHARLLLPDLLLFLLPVAALPPGVLRRVPARLGSVLLAVLVLWALVVAGSQRLPAHSPSSSGIVDERGAYASATGAAHPVDLDDYRHHIGSTWGRRGRALAARGDHVVLLAGAFDEPSGDLPSAGGTAIAIGSIGIPAVVAGPEVTIIDRIGLADPFAARMDPVPGGRVGHEKWMSTSWIEARFATASGIAGTDADAALARTALTCPPLQELTDAVSAPLTPGRFLQNLVHSPELTGLRIPSDPAEAVRVLC